MKGKNSKKETEKTKEFAEKGITKELLEDRLHSYLNFNNIQEYEIIPFKVYPESNRTKFYSLNIWDDKGILHELLIKNYVNWQNLQSTAGTPRSRRQEYFETPVQLFLTEQGGYTVPTYFNLVTKDKHNNIIVMEKGHKNLSQFIDEVSEKYNLKNVRKDIENLSNDSKRQALLEEKVEKLGLVYAAAIDIWQINNCLINRDIDKINQLVPVCHPESAKDITNLIYTHSNMLSTSNTNLDVILNFAVEHYKKIVPDLEPALQDGAMDRTFGENMKQESSEIIRRIGSAGTDDYACVLMDFYPPQIVLTKEKYDEFMNFLDDPEMTVAKYSRQKNYTPSSILEMREGKADRNMENLKMFEGMWIVDYATLSKGVPESVVIANFLLNISNSITDLKWKQEIKHSIAQSLRIKGERNVNLENPGPAEERAMSDFYPKFFEGMRYMKLRSIAYNIKTGIIDNSAAGWKRFIEEINETINLPSQEGRPFNTLNKYLRCLINKNDFLSTVGYIKNK